MLRFLAIGFVIFCNSVLAQDVDTMPSFTLSDKTVNGQEMGLNNMARSDVIHVPSISFNIFSSARPYVMFRNNLVSDQNIRSGYNVTPGLGAHKVHRRALSWNRARKFCSEEGGHLAVIKSESEAKILYQLMLDESVEDAWIGLHDQFEEGDWTSVTDEPIANVWGVWAKDFPNNPDNYQGKQHCARLVRKSKGMDDDMCSLSKSFICKISSI